MTKPDPDAPPDPESERQLDEALEETFPASDPISPMEPRERRPPTPSTPDGRRRRSASRDRPGRS